jgi:iron(III) transport system substrate-binding protein
MFYSSATVMGQVKADKTKNESAGAKVSESEAKEADQKIVLYLAKSWAKEKEILSLFEKETGKSVSVVRGTAEELRERLKKESEDPQADLFVAPDGEQIFLAKYSDLFEPLLTGTIRSRTADELRDIDNLWVGLTYWVRGIVYVKDLVNPSDLPTYFSLAAPKFKGRIILAAVNSDEISLVATLVKFYGTSAAIDWIKGLVNNLVRPTAGDDKKQILDLASNTGQISIVNSYVLGRMQNSPDRKEKEAAERVGLVFPDQSDFAAHANISAAALVLNAKNKDSAVRLAEFLLSPPAQELLASGDFEFPVNPEAKIPPTMEAWGKFKFQDLDFSFLGAYQNQAEVLMNQGGWK